MSKDLTNDSECVILTEKEQALIVELRKVGWGQVTVYILDGEPIRIEQIKEGLKL